MGKEAKPISTDLEVLKLIRRKNATVAKNLLKKIKRKQKKICKPSDTRAEYLKDILNRHYKSFDIHLLDKQGIDIEYVPEDIKSTGEFRDVFQRFYELERLASYEDAFLQTNASLAQNDESLENQFEDSDSDETEASHQMSLKKRLRLQNRPTLAQLKQIADRPEVVEIWDTTAADPRFLVWLKGLRNSVVVPTHWKEKLRYMQMRRGYEKPPYRLPPYIEATKISQIRCALQEKEANKSLKQKQREKARPKSHRMDIDYQTLHDAFFKYATKPHLTKFGDVYYQGKEMELRMRQFKPGQLSDRLKQALGVGENAPPPWLINMQRFGPPPSYPNLRIPGVNAPLPEGASFGFHAGGWGQLPLDDAGNPIFGFIDANYYQDHHIDKSYWGEVPAVEEDDYSVDEEEEQPPEETDEATQSQVMAPTASIPVLNTNILGAVTPINDTMMQQAPRKPYTVLKAKQTTSTGGLFGSNVVYQIPPVAVALPQSGGIATPLRDGLVTPSLNVDGASTTDPILRQLQYHEEKSKLARELAGQIDPTKTKSSETKKKKKFKF